MEDKIYLLSIRDLQVAESGEQYMRKAFAYADEKRRKKAGRMKQLSSKAACLGAGLLLRYALSEMSAIDLYDCETESMLEGSYRVREKSGSWEHVTLAQVFAKLRDMEECVPAFRYGPHGKPYLTNYPYYFNLSHSGEYVVCAISDREIGVDIQKHKDDDVMKLADRFFSGREREVLRSWPKEQQKHRFFDLWARKEAYGKWTGEGVVKILDLDLEGQQQDFMFEEYDGIPGYSIAVCKSGK